MTTATKVRFRFRLATSRQMRAGFWVGNPVTNTAVSELLLQDMVNDARTAVSTSSLMAGFDDDVNFEEMEAQNFVAVPFSAGPPERETHWEATTLTYESAGADIPGSITGNSLPPQNAPVYSIRSTIPGPKGRNRMYFPPLAESEVDSLGVIDSARLTQLNTDVLAVIVAAVAAADVNDAWVVASAGPLRSSIDQSDLFPAASAAFDNIVRSQRRRVTR